MSFVSRQKRPGLRLGALASDHVTIVMATYNGAKNIDAQLGSLAAQTHTNWSLIVSDDGSTDDTMQRVARFAAEHPGHRIIRLRGPKKGSAMNFLSLLRAAGNAPFVAFADQDDVWLPDRLERGLAVLAAIHGPAVYGGRTIIADAELKPLRLSPNFSRRPEFRNALVQNIAGGNTMLLNRAALDILQPASAKVSDLIAHDWWTYQMVTAVGGRMIWDRRPTVLYRQHGNNQIGANDTITASMERARNLLSGKFSQDCTTQIEALAPHRLKMTNEARASFDAFREPRSSGWQSRLIAFKRAGLWRQTWRGTAALWIAMFLGKF